MVPESSPSWRQLTPHSRVDALLEAQRQVLEKIVRGTPLPELLEALCTIVETQAERTVRAAILLVGESGQHLFTGAAPSLPEAYCRAVDGVPILPDLGTCSAAAARCEMIITEDIDAAPSWAALRHLPLDLGLVAAWSMPIVSSKGVVLGTFGTYFLEKRGPLPDELRLVRDLARTAALAIERQRSDEALRESADRHRFLSELSLATQPLAEASEIMATSARLLAEHLSVDRCAYAEVEDEKIFSITGDHPRGVSSIVGRWPIASFGPECERLMLAGEPYVVRNAGTDPRIDPEFLPTYRAADVDAVICVPLHKRGKLTAAMAVHQRTPRHWTSAELELVGTVVSRCWEALERARVTRTLRESLEREQTQARLLKKVAEAALTIHSSSALESVLAAITREARLIIGAHLAVSGLTENGDWAHAINNFSVSDKYRKFTGYDAKPTGAGIYSVVCTTNQPLRLTQAELEAHPGWREYSGEAGRHPPLRGWLAVPFVGRDGTNLGLIQLSDKEEGEFTETDEAILIQLAQIASVALENARLYDRLRDQDRRKDEFLATLAHELRNPLAPIRTGLQVLRMTTDEAKALRVREMMERQLGHLVRLVDDLLDVSRITLGKMRLRKECVEFRGVLESALETTRPLVEAGGHQLTVTLPEVPISIEADSTRVAQVVANLINNAAKYTPPGGKIGVDVALEGPMVEVRVTDTGVGIAPDMVSRVFDMFTQVGGSIERSQGGLGIGLTLVRRLVELHGGSVEAESAGPGRGSTFTVRLPCTSSASRETAASPNAAAKSSRGPLKVLIVDDNLDGAETLAMLVGLSGDETRLAHTGPDALAAAAEFRPDLVFLDIGLPGLSGYEVAERFRADPALRGATLVAVTGWGTDGDRRRAHEAGFDRHMVKPVEAAELTSFLSTIRGQ